MILDSLTSDHHDALRVDRQDNAGHQQDEGIHSDEDSENNIYLTQASWHLEKFGRAQRGTLGGGKGVVSTQWRRCSIESDEGPVGNGDHMTDRHVPRSGGVMPRLLKCPNGMEARVY